MAIVARVTDTNTVKGKITQSNPVQAKTVSIGQPQKLTDLTDIDSTQLANGATLIYDLASQTFKLTNEMDNPDTKIIGGKY
jgi:lipopolysaccharide export system protein LptA